MRFRLFGGVLDGQTIEGPPDTPEVTLTGTVPSGVEGPDGKPILRPVRCRYVRSVYSDRPDLWHPYGLALFRETWL